MYVSIEFCGVEFDEDDESLNLSIWSVNHTEDPIILYVKDLYINGQFQESYEWVGGLQSGESEFTDELIQNVKGISYRSIKEIEFEVEIDDEDKVELYDSKRLKVICDPSNETFKVMVIRDEIVDI